MTIPTRSNPDAILDKIITTLWMYYKEPYTISPLDNDENKKGKPSDHKVVVFEPLSHSDVSKQVYRKIKFRPFPESGMLKFATWVNAQSWDEVYQQKTAQKKAEQLQKMLVEKMNIYFPEKQFKVNMNDKPFMNRELKKLDRQRKKEYIKNKKSEKWKKLNTSFKEKVLLAKQSYYENIVEDLKESNPGHWHSKVKRMACNDPTKKRLLFKR